MKLLTLTLSKNPSHSRTGKANVKQPCLSAWVVESAMLLCFAQHWVLRCPPHGSLTRSSHSPGPSPQLQVIWPILSGEGMAKSHFKGHLMRSTLPSFLSQHPPLWRENPRVYTHSSLIHRCSGEHEFAGCAIHKTKKPLCYCKEKPHVAAKDKQCKT